jgi:hypothetical protein
MTKKQFFNESNITTFLSKQYNISPKVCNTKFQIKISIASFVTLWGVMLILGVFRSNLFTQTPPTASQPEERIIDEKSE